MVSTSALLNAPHFLIFETPDGDSGLAIFRLGKWRGLDRHRGFILCRRRSRRPYLESADGKLRIPVTVMAESVD